jgi:hypothetical protein
MYKVCIDRFKIEHNLKEVHKFGAIQNLQAPVMVIDEENNIVANCSEIDIVGKCKIIYSPEKKLDIPNYQITLWLEVEDFVKIK